MRCQPFDQSSSRSALLGTAVPGRSAQEGALFEGPVGVPIAAAGAHPRGGLRHLPRGQGLSDTGHAVGSGRSASARACSRLPPGLSQVAAGTLCVLFEHGKSITSWEAQAVSRCQLPAAGRLRFVPRRRFTQLPRDWRSSSSFSAISAGGTPWSRRSSTIASFCAAAVLNCRSCGSA